MEEVAMVCPAMMMSPEWRNISWSTNASAKLDRIETMEDALHSGRWQIAAHLVKSELWQQLQLVPHGTHDDGPDAMERAGSMLASSVDRAAFYGRDAPSTPSAGAGMPRGWR
jgi:hypothetical protein